MQVDMVDQIKALRSQIETLEQVCRRLEAERDAHLHVIEQLFKAILERASH